MIDKTIINKAFQTMNILISVFDLRMSESEKWGFMDKQICVLLECESSIETRTCAIEAISPNLIQK